MLNTTTIHNSDTTHNPHNQQARAFIFKTSRSKEEVRDAPFEVSRLKIHGLTTQLQKKFENMNFVLYTFFLVQLPIRICKAFIPADSHLSRFSTSTLLLPRRSTCTSNHSSTSPALFGWLDNFLPAPIENNDSQRRTDFPEQYPATYELNNIAMKSDIREAVIVRPLLKQTMLESRPLQKVFDAELHGWDPRSFHERVDGKGAAVVIATYQDDSETKLPRVVGGYNPKGWSSNGGARPSVAAFLFYEKHNDISTSPPSSTSTKSTPTIQKLQKCGGGGLACANDDPNSGISFGPDALVIPLQKQRPYFASSKLGPYFEKGPQNLSSLFENSGGGIHLESLKVLTGVYDDNEEIPYSGAVMDMTSG